MVKITVIGWYGTETIGDRAIFAGLLSLFSQTYQEYEIKWGSIYPFFTERTLQEDYVFYNYCAKREVKIEIFDTQNKRALDQAIKSSDILVMGGGPLMGIPSMFMVEYAFAKAKKLNKTTMVLGCGVGPMRRKLYERSLVNIIAKSDVTVFRDETSLLEYQRISKQTKGVSVIDPAVFASAVFKNSDFNCIEKQDVIVASIREFPEEYKVSSDIDSENINTAIIKKLSSLHEGGGMPMLLLPMHYFEIGGDDRKFLNQICFQLNNPDITVQNVPLSLVETMQKFSSARICIGMRFHSVVLQTLLNGNNMILDYTDPKTGKIGNFIRQIGATDHYKDSYVNLQIENKTEMILPEKVFVLDKSFISKAMKTYKDAMNNL